MKYAINIEPLYPGMDVCEKIRRVKAAGFDGIEFWGWKDKDMDAIKKTCDENGVQITAFCATNGESLCDAENAGKAIDWVKKSVEKARETGCDTLIVFPNHFTPNGAADFRDKYTKPEMTCSIIRSLTELAPYLEENGITLLLEPLHNHGADAGMSVTDTEEGAAIIRAVNSPNVRLLCDFFHMQLMHGNLTTNVLKNLDIVPYVHLADAPDRFEPGTGEINYSFILGEMKKSGYDGVVCFEYYPKDDTDVSLKAAKALCEELERA